MAAKNSAASKPEAPAMLVNQREAARLLSVSTRTVYVMTRDGRLPCVRIGRSVRYSPAQLANWIQAETAGPTVATTPPIASVATIEPSLQLSA